MNKCSNCQKPTNQEFRCTHCGTTVCSSCHVQEHHKCPNCGKHGMVKVGSVEDKKGR